MLQMALAMQARDRMFQFRVTSAAPLLDGKSGNFGQTPPEAGFWEGQPGLAMTDVQAAAYCVVPAAWSAMLLGAATTLGGEGSRAGLG